MAEFLHMGGYAFYVWSSYGMVAAVLGYHYFSPLIRRRKLLAELAGELASESTRESTHKTPGDDPPPPALRSPQ